MFCPDRDHHPIPHDEQMKTLQSLHGSDTELWPKRVTYQTRKKFEEWLKVQSED